MCLHATGLQHPQRREEGDGSPRKLQMIVSCHMCAGNQTWTYEIGASSLSTEPPFQPHGCLVWSSFPPLQEQNFLFCLLHFPHCLILRQAKAIPRLTPCFLPLQSPIQSHFLIQRSCSELSGTFTRTLTQNPHGSCSQDKARAECNVPHTHSQPQSNGLL